MHAFKTRFVGLSVTSMLATGVAFAGNSTTGGGDLVTERQNPWFVQNTAAVSYCIALDGDHFGSTLGTVRENIRDAMTYWQHEFRLAEPATEGAARIDVATQTFTEVPCSGHEELVFQMGVLSDAQAPDVGAPQTVIATAVRTDYDSVQLRGRGYIYVSPETGPLALASSRVRAQRWSVDSGRLLTLVLIHELGHVFGLEHTASPTDIMGADFPNSVCDRDFSALIATGRGLPHFFRPAPDSVYKNCQRTIPIGTPAEAVLSIPSDWTCAEIRVRDGGFEVWAAPSPAGLRQRMGTFVRTDGTEKQVAFLGTLVLTSAQAAFPLLQVTEPTPLVLYFTGRNEFQGVYTPDNGGAPRQVLAFFDAKDIDIGGLDTAGNLHLAVLSASGWDFDNEAPLL